MADEQWYYNTKTHAVEQGMVSPAVDRAGPYATREEAEHALAQIKANSEKWAAEDAAEDR
ncbi:SPOR domain-containing protein [Frondihabitans cladoniiphilus]